MKLNNNMKFEKENMNKIRYIINYRILPLYALFTMICLVIAGVLLETDESRYTPVAIGIFALIGIVTVALLFSCPIVRKIEIAVEMKRYDFDTSGVEIRGVYDFSDDGVSFSFDKNGMYVNDTFFWYNQLRVVISTSNYLNRIWITIMFFINESVYCQIPLNGDTISMIEKFNINLFNRETLDYIVNHKEKAFTKIYITGYI